MPIRSDAPGACAAVWKVLFPNLSYIPRSRQATRATFVGGPFFWSPCICPGKRVRKSDRRLGGGEGKPIAHFLPPKKEPPPPPIAPSFLSSPDPLLLPEYQASPPPPGQPKKWERRRFIIRAPKSWISLSPITSGIPVRK